MDFAKGNPEMEKLIITSVTIDIAWLEVNFHFVKYNLAKI